MAGRRLSCWVIASAVILVGVSASPAAAPKVKLTLSGPASATPGAAVSYRLAVRNTARRPAKHLRAELLLSADRRRDGKDAVLVRVALPTLRARKTVRRTLKARLPASA